MKRRSFIKYAGATSLAAMTDPLGIIESSARGKKLSLNDLSIQVRDGWDVIVVGGGPSGCTAASAAAREGARTLLIESMGALGGVGTSGLLNAWCSFSDGKEIIYKGLAERVYTESLKGIAKGCLPNSINHEHLKRIYDDLVISFGVQVLFFTSMAAVRMKDEERVDCVIVANKAGLTAYKAKVFVDCTGDGDLAVRAGAGFDMGDPQGRIQEGSLCFTVANADFDLETYPRVGAGRATSPVNKILGNPKYPLVKDNHCWDQAIGPGYVGFNAGHISVDATDPESLSSAMILGRKIAFQLHEGLKEFKPDYFENSFLAATAASMGIRESRRIRCDYTFTTEDWLARREFEDNIGRNCYHVDVHIAGGPKYPRYNKGESHGIPYRCLTPIGLRNVLVAGRCISTDQAALGSLRVMPPSLVTGEAAGLAAALAARSAKPDVHSVDIALLRMRLIKEGQRVD